ncbi:hypothetical protein NPIL_58351 [Nephila pilipes]|uniref:Uncharacterized protein n=1 Tax=Nephila pilipes TaxID=299642 RepID=A0A8X6NM90_NEPPI|nr:hypothetical protein NPIL_58351 [Nephila pilipes]
MKVLSKLLFLIYWRVKKCEVCANNSCNRSRNKLQVHTDFGAAQDQSSAFPSSAERNMISLSVIQKRKSSGMGRVFFIITSTAVPGGRTMQSQECEEGKVPSTAEIPCGSSRPFTRLLSLLLRGTRLGFL